MGTRRTAVLLAAAVHRLVKPLQYAKSSHRVSALPSLRQHAIHAPQQQADVRWTALSRALCSTGSPPQMVSILPGRCRGAPLEVDKLAGKHEDASIGVDADRLQSNAAASTSAASQRLPQPRERVTCDYTLLAACVHELRHRWLPAKVDQVLQADDSAICLQLRFVAENPGLAMEAPEAQDSPGQSGKHSYKSIKYPWLVSRPGAHKGTLSHLADSRGMVKGHLWLVWDTNGAARLAMGPPPERGAAAEQFSFGSQMAEELRGLILLDATLPRAWERVALLRFGPRLDEPPTRHVCLEVQGRLSNIVLTEAEMARDGWPIIAAGRQIGSKQSSQRQLQAQGVYMLPPLGRGLQPSLSESADVWQGILLGAAGQLEERYEPLDKAIKGPPSVRQAVVRAYQGVSPSLVGELCASAGLDADTPAAQLQRGDWDTLHRHWRAWLLSITTGTFAPRADPSTGRVSVLAPLSTVAAESFSKGQDHEEMTGSSESVHQLLDDALRSTEGLDVFARKRHQLQRAVGNAVSRLRAKLAALTQQEAATEKADATRKQADLLTANLYRCQQGDAQIEVEDWETGGAVVIKLDPLKAPADVARELYRVARKQGRTGDAIAPIMQEVQNQLEEVHEIDFQLAHLAPSEEGAMDVLRGIQEELVGLSLMKPEADAALAQKSAAQAARAARRRKDTALKEFRSATTPNGLEVLIGRNNRENDRLSHRMAARTDLWFHARGYPGSHTVLRIPPGRVPAEADVAFAASCAAFFSKARNEGKVPVAKAAVSDLSKPAGAVPGKVVVMREEVVVGRPAEAAAYFGVDQQ